MMNMQDPGSSELRRYVSASTRNEAYEQDKEKRKFMPHAAKFTIVEWAVVIVVLLVICAAIAFHFGLLVL